jgi:hypothetical protein
MRYLRRAVAVVVIVCIIRGAVPLRAADERVDASLAGVRIEPTLLATARRIAAAEPLRDAASTAAPDAPPTCGCRASLAEKLAWLYALVGGSLLTIYGPQEREDGMWTLDGKSETVAGAAALVLSFALLKDIRSRSAAARRATTASP